MNSGTSPSELLKHISSQQNSNFNYGALKTKTRITVQQLTSEIKALMRRSTQDIIDIGQKLVEVKQHLGHGNFINWLKLEFNWSISAATKFMQVWEQFKFVNFTNLNITASALYLIAAPSTSDKARTEVLERASLGETISYTKAKEIVRQHKKTIKLKSEETVSFEVSKETTKRDYSKFTQPPQDKTLTTSSASKSLIGREAEIEMCPLSSHYLPLDEAFNATTNQDALDNTIQTPIGIVNLAVISQEKLDVVLTEIAISIKKLTPEQLASVIKKSANKGLSKQHLKAIITASEQILNIGDG